MTNGDRIRSMEDEELSVFLFNFMIENITEFFKTGGSGCRNAIEMKEWVEAEQDGE